MISRTMPANSDIRTRSVEMFLATIMVLQGLIFLLPGKTLNLEQWQDLRAWVEVFPGDEDRFGMLVSFVGVARWAALIVNGRWYPTPGIRIAGCMIGSVYWFSIGYSFFMATKSLPGVPASLSWVVAAIAFETFSSVRAAKDAYTLDTFGARERRYNVRHLR